MLLNNQIGFIFDHDGVIADNESLHEKAWQNLFTNHNIKISKDEYLIKAKGFATKDTVNNFFPDLSDEKKQKLILEKMDIYEELMKKYLKPIAGVIEFIKKSTEMGIKIGIGSGGHRKRIDYSIEKFELQNYIKIIKSVEDVTNNKPNPEVYLKVIEDLGIPAKNCFIFEDSATGLTAANGTGANVIFANTSNIKIDKNIKFDLEIPNFLNLKPEDILKINEK